MRVIETNAYTVLQDDNGRCIKGWGQELPTVDWMTKGATFWDENDQKEYYWDGSAWQEVLSNPNFNGYYWDDLTFAAQGINPPGAASDPARNTTTGLLEFSGTADNIIAGVAQMPHMYKRGTDLSPHIHVRFINASTDDTRWKIEWETAVINGDFPSAYGTYANSEIVTFTNPNNAKKHCLIPWTDWDGTDITESAIINWKISRLASSDAADDDTGACAFLDFDIHYQKDKMGSLTEIP